MTIATQVVTVSSSTPTLVSIPLANEALYEHKVALSVQNLDSSIIIYLGGPAVSSSNFGYQLIPGADYAADLTPNDLLYAIAASGSPIVAVLAAEA